MADFISLDAVRSMAEGPAESAGPSFISLEDLSKQTKQADRKAFVDMVNKRDSTDVAYGVRRSVRDALDTGAEGLSWLYGKAVGNDSEYRRVKAMNEAARAKDTEGRPVTGGSVLGYVGGNTLTATPILRGVQGAVSAVPALRTFGNSIISGGMNTGRTLPAGAGFLPRAGDMATRVAGGAVNGLISGGLADPDLAGTSAAVGAGLPPVLQVVRAGTRGLGQVASSLRPAPGVSGADVAAARDIAEIAGADPRNIGQLAALRDQLRPHGPNIIPGPLSVPEILQHPGVSQLQRSVAAVNAGPFVERAAERAGARRDVLERIAPLGPRQEVAEEVGGRISSYAIPAERAARERVSALFDSIPAQEATMHLPLQRMQDAQNRFVGPGSFGKGEASVEQAMRTATQIGMDQATLTPRVVPFNQIQALRSSVNEAITEARMYGRNQAAAALTQMKNAIDDKVAEVAAGTRQPGEVFTPQAIDAWGQALRQHAVKKSQFNTGPQAGLFRQGGDGLPMAQGAEIPGRFFNAKPSQIADAQSFRRLVAEDPALMQELRRYAVSDAASAGSSRTGELTNASFNRWMDRRLGAIGETFTDQQRAWLKAIAEDLRRADMAESLGRSTGSDTAQKAAHMVKHGFMDTLPGRAMTRSFPGGGLLGEFLAGPARTARAERFANLLNDPEKVSGLLEVFIASQQPRPQGLLGQTANPLLYRGAPLLLPGAGGN